MKSKLGFTLLFCFALLLSSLSLQCIAWSNGGFSSDPQHPKYGTHDWIAEHALDWLPPDEKQFIIVNLAWFLYGTELPDNPNPPYGIGDTSKHHVYYRVDGSLQDDASAVRAQEECMIALAYAKAGDWANASMRLGAMAHYISDVAVFSHLMGSNTDWGSERHHSDYETYVNGKTNSYYDDFNVYLKFDGALEIVSAYNATLLLAYDTTFDVDGDLTCIWMDGNYNWSNPIFVNRVGESLNLAVNLIADVLHTFYLEYTSSIVAATVTFSAIGLDSDALETVLTIDGIGYTYSQLPLNITRTVGSSISFSWTDYVGAGYGKRYVWSSSSGLSGVRNGTVMVPVGGSSIVAVYKTQYQLKLQVDPADAGTLNPPEGSYWYNEGETITVSASPSPGYIFDSWVGSYSDVANSITITVNQPIVETAIFTRPPRFTISISPSSSLAVSGGSSSATITVTLVEGSAETVSLSTLEMPSGFSASFNPNSGSPTFTSTMTVTVPKSTTTGIYRITVVGSSGGLAETVLYTLIVIQSELLLILFGVLMLIVVTAILRSKTSAKRRRRRHS
ncbi:MAG: zinc dependent phospholipase C family protein [Candidatus Bathyarchaeia archaeon]